MPKFEAGDAVMEEKAEAPTRPKARYKFKPAKLKLSASEAAQPLSTASLHDQLVVRLRQMVLEGEIAPGSPLPERMLCETFGVSRTPLREAFKVLASEGLMELRPHRTPVVTPVDREEIAAMFQVMVALDHLAADLACRTAGTGDRDRLEEMHAALCAHHRAGARTAYFRQNQDIHAEITRLAGNPVLQANWSALSAKIYRARAQVNYNPRRWEESLAEHEGFMARLRAGDAPGFATAMADHTRRTADAVLASLDAQTEHEA
ncbi:GntR family transcriptional regulator [Aquabacter sp. L1I39]|uniref:GntR family transcriptional regulator n=1 Tax=Aquabacter sp. L1I39 TaxID=2820278 RepID=UPI001FFCB4B8|nr:GntR family transcriptional regulator [Aquabacter sp. L1I39]